MIWSDWDKAVMALCIWREARGEPLMGQKAIAHVILNRMKANTPGVHAAVTAADVVEAKWQFSSMTAPGDPMLVQWPRKPDLAFEQCMFVAEGVLLGSFPDPTDGATHYFNPNVVLPVWAAQMTKVASIGHHDFYR